MEKSVAGGDPAMIARSHVDLHNIRAAVERIGNLSDNVFHFGPVKLGLEAALEIIPGVGEVYSVIAGLLLLFEGIRARVPSSVLMSVTVLVLIRTVMGGFLEFTPLKLVGDLAAGLFSAHKASSNMIIKAMEETIYIEGTRREAMSDPEIRELVARIRSGKEKRRVVFLG